DASDIPVPAGADVQSLAGRGAEGQVNGVRVLLGNHRLFEERHLCSPALHERLDELAAAGRTAVVVARDGEAIGVIAVADQVRDAGRDAVDLLRRQKLTAVVLLTGDSEGPARAIATEVGVDEWRSELLPEDKVAAIAELRRRYGPV